MFLKSIKNHLHQHRKDALAVLQIAVRRFGEERGAEAAASMAYYGFFSMFPLLLLLVAVGSQTLARTLSPEQILEILLEIFPFSGNMIHENLIQVLRARGSFGVAGLVGLAWSATGAFMALAHHINRAWPDAAAHNYFRRRLLAFGILALLVAVLVTLLVVNTMLRIVLQQVDQYLPLVRSSQWVTHLLIAVFVFLSISLLYWLIPRTRVRWREAMGGALITALGIELITSGFTWYLRSGMSNYNLVYGSLGAMVALLFWIYLLSLIVFFGAYLSAAIAQQTRPKLQD